MSPLVYLYLTRLKNSIKALLHKPGRLIYILILAAICVFAAVGGSSGSGNRPLRDFAELSAIATGLYIVMFLFTAWNGFSKGGSMFLMADVTLLFPSPLAKTRVLFYGLFRQINTSLLLGLFIFYQYSWMHNVYGVGLAQLLWIFFGYVLSVFFGQVTAMTIYAFTSNNVGRRNVIKGIYFLLLALLVGYLAWRVLPGGQANLLPNLVAAVHTLPIQLFPIGGWLGLSFGGILAMAVGLGLCVVWLVLLLVLLTYFDQDWYEDVIRTAELAQSALAAQKEGYLESAPEKVRLGATGFSKGWGASAFYYKHKVENRRGRRFFLSRLSLFFAIAAIVFAYFVRDAGVLGAFAFATYMQLFTTGLSRINRELTKPFIYLVPEPPFAKLVHCLREIFPSATGEAIVIFVPIGLILDLPIWGIAVCILARISYGFLFQAGNLLVERIWPGGNKVVTVLLYFVLMVVMAAPGIAVAIVLAIIYPVVGIMGGLLVAAAINIPVAALVLFLCRNMLQYAEYNY